MIPIRGLRAPVHQFTTTAPMPILRVVPKPHRAHDRWRKEQDEQLRQLADIGITAAAIAKAMLGPSRNAVIGRAHRLGIQIGPKDGSDG